VQIPGQADEETRKRIESSAQMQLRAVLATTAASTSFVGEDGNPRRTRRPTRSRLHPDGVAHQRQRPQLGHPALQAKFLAYDCSNKANDPANSPQISR
jgi:preprotein translocase subunit SecD